MFRTSPEKIEAMIAKLRKAAANLGLPFGERVNTYNSRLAQELGKWAESLGSGDRFHHEAFRAYFAEGLNLARTDTLLQIVDRSGLSTKDAVSILEKRSFSGAVDDDWQQSRSQAVTAVPTFVMEHGRLIGAQSFASLARFVVAGELQTELKPPNNAGVEETQKNMNSVAGDLIAMALDGQFDVIVHGCNCFCSMGGGIARSIQEEFPEAYAADLLTVKGDRNKPGTFSFATVTRNDHRITIVNGYTQFHFQGESVLTDYNAVRNLFIRIKEQFAGKRIGYPKIGAGLGGGNWEQISSIIDEELAGANHTLVVYQPDQS